MFFHYTVHISIILTNINITDINVCVMAWWRKVNVALCSICGISQHLVQIGYILLINSRLIELYYCMLACGLGTMISSFPAGDVPILDTVTINSFERF